MNGWLVISLDLVVCVYIGGVDWFVPRCAGVKCGDTLRLGAGAFFWPSCVVVGLVGCEGDYVF